MRLLIYIELKNNQNGSTKFKSIKYHPNLSVEGRCYFRREGVHEPTNTKKPKGLCAFGCMAWPSINIICHRARIAQSV